jgi:[ribosomal protein S5]-alanine N-acetyltransferase
MEIKTERLILKETDWIHIEYIHRLHSIPEVDEFNTLGIPKDIDETKKIIRPSIEDKKNEDRKQISWTIFLKNTNEFIGAAGMHLSADKFKLGEIYYKLLPSHWGKGYATEIAKSLIKFGFDEMHLHKVEAGVQTENIQSIRVLEKAGMTREGLRRRILPIRGEWKDNYHYAIVENDPRDY